VNMLLSFIAYSQYHIPYERGLCMEHAVAWLVEALCYKPEGRRFDSRCGHSIFFNLPNPSSRTMALGSTQPLTEMSTRNLPEG
jgi:hypothetical protein